MIPAGLAIISANVLPVINPRSEICAEEDTVPALTAPPLPNPNAVICAEDDTIPDGLSMISA